LEFSKAIKQSKFNSNYEMALLNLWYTSNYIRDNHQSVFKDYDIKAQHYNVLRIINGQHPKPVSPGYIIDVMLDKGRDLTRLVDKLVKIGYLHRCTREDNRRKVAITITPEGQEVVREIGEKIAIWVARHKNLNEEESEQLSRLLDKMRK
jgi:DNA-binding MarR family transcriptional regulator